MGSIHAFKGKRYEKPAQPPIVAGRPPPHDLAAERAVISAALLKGSDAFAALAAVVEPKSFYSESHSDIWQAISDVVAAAKPIDLVSVRNRLEANGALQRAGGSAYLADVVDATPAVGNLMAHAQIVRELASLRAFIGTLQLYTALGYDQVADPRAFMTEAMAEAEKAARTGAIAEGSSTLREAMLACRAELQERRDLARFGGRAGLPYNIPDLERIFGRIQPKTITVLSAKTKGYKSTVGIHIAMSVAGVREKIVRADGQEDERGCGVAIFALEQTASEVEFLASCALAGLKREAFLDGTASDADFAAREYAEQSFDRMPVIIDTRTDLSIANLANRVRELRFRFQHEYGVPLRLVMIDTIQIFAFGEESDPSKQASLTDAACRGIRKLSTRDEFANVAWLELSQENDDGKTFGSRAPIHHCTAWIQLEVTEDDSQFAQSDVWNATFTIKENRHGKKGKQASVWLNTATGRVGDGS